MSCPNPTPVTGFRATTSSATLKSVNRPWAEPVLSASMSVIVLNRSM